MTMEMVLGLQSKVKFTSFILTRHGRLRSDVSWYLLWKPIVDICNSIQCF